MNFPVFISDLGTGNKGDTDLHFEMTTEICKPKFSNERMSQDQVTKRGDRQQGIKEHAMCVGSGPQWNLSDPSHAGPEGVTLHLVLIFLHLSRAEAV